MRSDPLNSYHALAVFLEIFSVHQQLYFALLKALSEVFRFLFFRLPMRKVPLSTRKYALRIMQCRNCTVHVGLCFGDLFARFLSFLDRVFPFLSFLS